MAKGYSVFSLLRHALKPNSPWPMAWEKPTPRSSYDVVIIGGGGHGLATAYYLAKNHGITNVAVLERAYIGSGNVGRNTTLIRSNYVIDGNTQFFEHSMKLWEGLSHDLNYNCMVSHRGQIVLAVSPVQLDTFARRGNMSQSLERNTTLISLILIDEKLNFDAVGRLTCVGCLTFLDLSFGNIRSQGLRSLFRGLETNTHLKSLNLRHNTIDLKSAKSLGHAIKNNVTLTNLDLSRICLKSKFLEAICLGLKFNVTLSSLDLDGNHLGPSGAKIMFGCLGSLTSLSFSNTGLDLEGVKIVAETLSFNTTLRHLDLSHNRINYDGGLFIAQMLSHNTSLTSLDLDFNSLGVRGVCAILNALEYNDALVSLGLLGYSGLNFDHLWGLCPSLERNSSLVFLNLGQGSEHHSRNFHNFKLRSVTLFELLLSQVSKYFRLA